MIDQAFFGRFGCGGWWRDSYEGLSPAEILAILPEKCKSNLLRKALVQRSSNKGSKDRVSGDQLRIHDSGSTGLEEGSVA